MTHPLAVYTVIYLAILFVTVSIWGSSLANVTGDTRVLLFTVGAFSLKLAIDDYVHFQNAKRGQLQFDLLLSLLMYLFLAGSIAHAAIGRTRVASLQFAGVFLLGAMWLVRSGLEGEARTRRIGWLMVNVLAIILLVIASMLGPQETYTRASAPLSVLFGIVVFDFFYFGTLRRLAETADTTHTGCHVCAGGKRDPLRSPPADDADAAARAAEAAGTTVAGAEVPVPVVGQNPPAQ